MSPPCLIRVFVYSPTDIYGLHRRVPLCHRLSSALVSLPRRCVLTYSVLLRAKSTPSFGIINAPVSSTLPMASTSLPLSSRRRNLSFAPSSLTLLASVPSPSLPHRRIRRLPRPCLRARLIHHPRLYRSSSCLRSQSAASSIFVAISVAGHPTVKTRRRVWRNVGWATGN